MCGIFGMAIPSVSGFVNTEVDCLVSNMNINMFRGSDSTGMVQVDKDGAYNFLKVVGGPSALCDSPKWDNFKKGLYTSTKLAFGHGRAATRGKVTLKNAHPFQVFKDASNRSAGEIILVHNGTLHTYQTLDGFHEHDVDSEWMAKKIAELGPMEALGKINGAIATVWYDPTDKALYFYRNDDRPLHYAWTKNGFMFWNSEKCALMWLKYRYNLAFEAEDVVSLKPLHLHKLNIADISKFEEVKEVPRIYPTYVPASNSLKHYHGGKYYGPRQDSIWGNWNMVENLARGYEEDIKNVYLGVFQSVTFAGGKRITIIGKEDRHYTSTEMMQPYVNGLLSITFADEQNTVRIVYEDRTIYVTPQNIEPKIAVGKNQIVKSYNYAVPLDWDNIKIGDRAKFETDYDGVKNRHSCRFDKYSIHSLDNYWNNYDGHFSVGMKVTIDIHPEDNQKIGISSYRVRGTRSHWGKIDQFVEFYFFAPTHNGVYNGIYEGTVSLMTFSDEDEFEESGALVKMLLKDVKYLGVRADYKHHTAEVIDIKSVVLMLDNDSDTVAPENA